MVQGAEFLVSADGSESTGVYGYRGRLSRGDFKKATQTVFHQDGAASGIELMVMPK